MWPLTKLSDEQVTFCIRPDKVVCCWVQRSGKRALLQVKAYKSFKIDAMAVTPYTIASPTALERCMKQFLIAHNLHDARINIVLDVPHVEQNIVTVPHATPSPATLRIPGKKQIVWDYYYMYPTESNKHAFYTCAIDQALLLQYKLMAVRMQAYVNIITTQYTALLAAYRHMYGAAFRASQLAVDMHKHGNQVERLFTPEMARRIVTLPAESDLQTDGIDILSACGLFVMGDEA
jgi:hypothetical protein